MADASTTAATTASTGESDTRLRRSITGPLLFLFVLGDVLGAGIYALMGVLSKQVGGALWLPLLLALVMALFTASSYAELVTKYPKAGGSSVYADRAFKRPVISFLVGFCMLSAGVVSAAGLSLAFAGDYLATFLDVPAVPAALVFLAVVAALNARGIRESMASNVVMTIIELSGLLIVIVAGAVVLGSGSGEPARVLEFRDGVSPWAAVLGATIIAFYSFVGFETSANVAEELRTPRNYPKALFGALAVAGAVYVLVALASSITLSPGQLGKSSGPLLAVVSASGIGVPEWLFSVIALIAVANGALLTMIMASRMTYGMAEQGLLPRVFGRVLPNRRTPWVAIVATTLIAMALTLLGDLSILAETVVFLLLFVFGSTNIAVLVLRRDKVDHPHFRAWTVLPILGVASCVLLLTQQQPKVWLFGAIVLVVGAVVFLVARRVSGVRGSAAVRETASPDEDSAPSR
ncbi:APC family permease [Rathayibacter sp. YIM 133350]|uniref:APC family permease n=1 Tax=Rathayibacter sp. YIM 133350 TaxID=3131992 RepID=UPI00307ED857